VRTNLRETRHQQKDFANLFGRPLWIKSYIRKEIKMYRGQVFYADLSSVKGSEQGGVRPVVILQNNVGNRHAPTTIVAPATTLINKRKLPTHVVTDQVFPAKSTIMLEQIRTIDKSRIQGEALGELPQWVMEQIDKALKISLGIT
jgi:mRNA interferase MazF